MQDDRSNLPEEELKTDLKHDTMEFSAASDGDDKLDIDDETYEEEGITADELDNLEEDDIDQQAKALNAVETDRQADEDNLPEEDWLKDIPGADADNVSSLEEVDLDEEELHDNENDDFENEINSVGSKKIRD